MQQANWKGSFSAISKPRVAERTFSAVLTPVGATKYPLDATLDTLGLVCSQSPSQTIVQPRGLGYQVRLSWLTLESHQGVVGRTQTSGGAASTPPDNPLPAEGVVRLSRARVAERTTRPFMFRRAPCFALTLFPSYVAQGNRGGHAFR